MDDSSTTLMHQFNKAVMLLSRYQYPGGSTHGPFTNPYRGQGRILAILRIQPEISQKDLAYMLDIRNQSLSELLAKMEKAGYITRTQSETDRRVVDIKLTDAGRKAAEQSDQQKEGNDDPFSVLNEEERTNLSDYLTRIIAGLEEKVTGQTDWVELLGARFEMTPEMIKEVRAHQFTPEILEQMRSRGFKDRGFSPEMLNEFKKHSGFGDI